MRQEVIAFRWAHGLQTDQVFHVRRMIPGAVVAMPAPLQPTSPSSATCLSSCCSRNLRSPAQRSSVSTAAFLMRKAEAAHERRKAEANRQWTALREAAERKRCNRLKKMARKQRASKTNAGARTHMSSHRRRKLRRPTCHNYRRIPRGPLCAKPCGPRSVPSSAERDALRTRLMQAVQQMVPALV